MIKSVLVLFTATITCAIYDLEKTDHIIRSTYPFLVSIKAVGKINSEHDCGGVIISQDYVLTSADCFMNRIGREIDRLTAGSPRLNYGGSLHLITEKHIHQDYEKGNHDSNIALAKVSPSFRFGENINSAPLAIIKDPSSSVHFAGWGAVNRTAIFFGSGFAELSYAYLLFLRDVKLQVIENKECNEYGMGVSDKQTCTLTHVGQGLCFKDHGGPLIIKNGKDMSVLAIATKNNSCGDGFPDVYTKVSPFIDWINGTCKCIS